MTHSRVDRIMKKVEKYYRGDFLINDDWEYSRTLAKKYRAQYANQFIGTNGTFEIERMFCTESCSRVENGIRLSAGGIVFGPYFAFPAGDFAAIYDLTGDLHGCRVEVSSQKVGSIASGNAEDLMRDGKVVLPFSLPEGVPDLELKTINSGSGEIVFKKVTVSDHLDTTQEETAAQQEDITEFLREEPEEKREEEPEIIQEDVPDDIVVEYVAGTYIQDLRDMSRGSASAYQGLQIAAECALPQRTRFRRIKQFLRKLMNCFITFQLDFNRRIVALFGDMNHEMQFLAASIAEESSETQRVFSESVKLLNRRIVQQNKLITRQSERISRQNEQITQQSERLSRQNEQISRQNEQLSRQNEQIEGLREELEAYRIEQMERQDLADGAKIDDSRLEALEREMSILTEAIGELRADSQRLDKAEQKLLGISRTVVDLVSDRERLEKNEYELQKLAESMNGMYANDTRLEEIGQLWAKVEEAIRLLHEYAGKKE